MGSVLYDKVLSVAAGYIGEDKARRAIGRQLERCQATPETLDAAQFSQVINFLVGAVTLPLYPDKEKVQELGAKIRALQ